MNSETPDSNKCCTPDEWAAFCLAADRVRLIAISVKERPDNISTSLKDLTLAMKNFMLEQFDSYLQGKDDIFYLQSK